LMQYKQCENKYMNLGATVKIIPDIGFVPIYNNRTQLTIRNLIDK